MNNGGAHIKPPGHSVDGRNANARCVPCMQTTAAPLGIAITLDGPIGCIVSTALTACLASSLQQHEAHYERDSRTIPLSAPRTRRHEFGRETTRGDGTVCHTKAVGLVVCAILAGGTRTERVRKDTVGSVIYVRASIVVVVLRRASQRPSGYDNVSRLPQIGAQHAMSAY